MNQVELEQNVIAATLADPELADDLIQKCKPNYFTDNKMKKIYNWIVKKRNNNEQLSVVKLATEVEVTADELPEKDLFHEFDDSLDLLHKNYIRRNLKSVSKDIYNLAKKKDLDIDEYLHKSQEMIFKVTSELDKAETQYNLQEAMMSAYKSFCNRREGIKEDYISTGFPSMDHFFGGLKRTHLTVLGAETSVGKTAFATSVAKNIMKDGGKVAFISLEMEASEIAERLVTMKSRVPAQDFREADKLSEGQQKAINHSWDYYTEMEENLWIDENRSANVDDITAVCRKLNKDADGLDLIIVDYLQMIDIVGDDNKADLIGKAVKDLRALALQLNVPIILLSQLKKFSDNRKNRKPTKDDLRGSSLIGQIADDVWMLYRPDMQEDKNPQVNRQPTKVPGLLIQEKGRTSGTGALKFYFYPQIGLWEDRYLVEDQGKIIEMVK